MTVRTVLLLACSLVVLLFLIQPLDYLAAAFVIDDGLYYLEVARNIVSGNGVTYDNRTFTNGVHPLWGVICVVTALIAGTDSETLFLAAVIVQGIMALGSLYLFWRIAADLKLAPLAAAIGGLAIFFARLDLWLSTMESATLLFFLLLLLAVSLRRKLLYRVEARENALLGILLALAFLARTDHIFIVVGFLAAQSLLHLHKRPRFSSLKPVIVTGAIFTAVCSPYLIANRIYFGSIVPVSGMKKMSDSFDFFSNLSTFSRDAFRTITSKTQLPELVIAILLLVGAGVFAWICLRPQCRPWVAALGEGLVLPAFLAGVALRSAYLLSFIQEYSQVPWYWVPEYVLFSFLGAAGLSLGIRFLSWEWLGKPILTYALIAPVFAAGSLYLILDARAYQETNHIPYDAALWIKDAVPEDKLFAMYDSGVVAFFSDRDVIPLNGLITDRRTMERLSQGGYIEVMNDFGVDYVISYINAEIDIPAEALLYRSEIVPKGFYYNSRLTIFKYKEHPEATIEALKSSG